MPKPVFLLGAGGHGRVTLDALLLSGVSVAGVLDPALEVGSQVFGVPVMGGDDFLAELVPADVLLVNGLGANPSVSNRKKLYENMKERGYSFDLVKHPSIVIGRDCRFGESSQIMAAAVLQSRVLVGDNAVINSRASIDHDCMVGNHAFVSPGAVLCGGVKVGESAFIGAAAVVIPDIHIGAGAIVGAGAVVTKPVSERCIVAGNPAVKIGMNV